MDCVKLQELGLLTLVTEVKGCDSSAPYIYSKVMEPKMIDGKTSSRQKSVQFLAGCSEKSCHWEASAAL